MQQAKARQVQAPTMELPMTKKHFIALAKALAQTQDKLSLTDFEQLIEAVAEVCANASPAFNFTAFYATVKAEPFVKPSHGTTRMPGQEQK